MIWSTATCDGNRNVAGMRAVLPAGVFYRHQFGSQFPPNPAIVALFPGLEFTTHIRAAFDPFGSTTILGGWPQSAIVSLGDATSAIPGTFSITWGDLANDPPGTWQIARLTFPLGLLPNVINIADVGPQGPYSQTLQSAPDSEAEIPDILEPPIAAIAALGTLLLRRAGG